MVIQFGVKEHIKMAETYQWAEEELVKYLKLQNELIDDSKRYWNGETADAFRRDYEYMLQEGEYAAFMKHVRGMKEVMEESIPRFRLLQQMVVELPTAYGLPCDEEAPEILRLDEEAVAKYHELSDEIIARNRHFCEEMTRIMDGCEGLVDFSEEKRELEELREEMHQMEVFKRKLDEYADEMRRLDNWMVERLSEFVKIGDSGNMPEKGMVFTEYQPERPSVSHVMDIANQSSAITEATDIDAGEGDLTGQGKEKKAGEKNIVDIFASCDEAIRIGIGLLDVQLCAMLGICNINTRIKIITALLDSMPNIFQDLYHLSRTSNSDYQNVMAEILAEAGNILNSSQNEIGDEEREIIVLCDSVVAYRGYPNQEGFDHIIQLNVGENVAYNPYDYIDFNDLDSQQENSETEQQTICFSPNISDRNNIVHRDWYSYMEKDLEYLESYYNSICGYDCTREENQLTVDTGEKEYSFQLIDDKWLVDENGRYLITVGPNVLNMEYDGGCLDFIVFEPYFGCRIDVILVNDTDPEDILTLECIYGGNIKEHTYPEGLYMTGCTFPNGKQTDDPDGSFVEFLGKPNLVDENNPDSERDNGIMSNYHVELIIVYENDNAEEDN